MSKVWIWLPVAVGSVRIPRGFRCLGCAHHLGGAMVVLLCFGLPAPQIVWAQSGLPGGLVEWSATIGDWFTDDDDAGVLQIVAARVRYEEPRQALALIWLRWDADAQAYVEVKTLAPLEICGAIEFQRTALALFSDASPKFADVVLQVHFLAEEPDSAEARTLFMVVDKMERGYELLNCR